MILACRDLKSAYVVREEIIEETYNRNVDVKHLDLSSLDSIADFSSDIIRSKSRINKFRPSNISFLVGLKE